jgi:hypothetical protein
MRRYTPDSPQAMARVIALAMLSDGGLDDSEINAVSRSQLLQRVGITTVEFDVVLHDLCTDMQQFLGGVDFWPITIDDGVIEQLLSDIKAPRLQRMAISTMLAVVDANGHFGENEAKVIALALANWRLDLHEGASASRFKDRTNLRQSARHKVMTQ